MRLLLSTALLAFLLCLAVGCGKDDKVVMPTKTYEPPRPEDVSSTGGTVADQPEK